MVLHLILTFFLLPALPVSYLTTCGPYAIKVPWRMKGDRTRLVVSGIIHTLPEAMSLSACQRATLISTTSIQQLNYQNERKSIQFSYECNLLSPCP
jgi:hypothetical protein